MSGGGDSKNNFRASLCIVQCVETQIYSCRPSAHFCMALDCFVLPFSGLAFFSKLIDKGGTYSGRQGDPACLLNKPVKTQVCLSEHKMNGNNKHCRWSVNNFFYWVFPFILIAAIMVHKCYFRKKPLFQIFQFNGQICRNIVKSWLQKMLKIKFRIIFVYRYFLYLLICRCYWFSKYCLFLIFLPIFDILVCQNIGDKGQLFCGRWFIALLRLFLPLNVFLVSLILTEL